MERRGFIKRLGLGTAVLSGAGMLSLPSFGKEKVAAAPFKLDFAPHFGMFKQHAPGGILDELRFMADQGFRSLEDNGLLKRPIAEQELIGKTLSDLGMRMGVFVVDGGDNWKVSLASGKPEFMDKFLATCRASVEAAKRVNAKWMTVVPGYFDRNLPIGVQTGHVIDALKRGAEIFEPHGLTMVLEPLSDNPDLFLRHADQTYMICRAVGSPACKILYDAYHMQRNEGNLIATMEKPGQKLLTSRLGIIQEEKSRAQERLITATYSSIFTKKALQVFWAWSMAMPFRVKKVSWR
jgi:hydroxypyruvate isomerase